MFAFGLGELQDLRSLGAEGIRERIYSAGITGAGRSATEALAQIDRAADKLYRPGRGKSRVGALVLERHIPRELRLTPA